MARCKSKNHGDIGLVLFVNLAGSVPRKGTARLVLNHTGFKEIAFFLQVDHLAHPREWILFVREESFKPDLRGAAIGNVA